MSTENADVVKRCCDYCGTLSSILKTCSRCGWAKYCDRVCQKSHWKRRHKLECKAEPDRSPHTSGLPPDHLMSVLYSEFARLNQGGHEVEVVHGSDLEADCQLLRRRCMKHPGHHEFIPILKLTLDHLPPGWQDQSTLETVKYEATRTVRLKVGYTSWGRPEPVGLTDLRGRRITRFGTGYLETDFICTQNIDSNPIPCPFKNCKVSEGPHLVSRPFYIRTAYHVVFDDSEAQETTVEFFYDDESNRASVVKAQGLRLSGCLPEHDACLVVCVTHDLNFFELCMERDKIFKKESMKHPNNISLAYIISHPHGCSKHVTFGEVTNREYLSESKVNAVEEVNSVLLRETRHLVCKNIFQSRLQYTIPTCPGSSGALVNLHYRLGRNIIGSFAVHSRHLGDGVNESGMGTWVHYDE